MSGTTYLNPGLPAPVAEVESGPAILVIGDVVAHSLPWLTANIQQLSSQAKAAAQ